MVVLKGGAGLRVEHSGSGHRPWGRRMLYEPARKFLFDQVARRTWSLGALVSIDHKLRSAPHLSGRFGDVACSAPRADPLLSVRQFERNVSFIPMGAMYNKQLT